VSSLLLQQLYHCLRRFRFRHHRRRHHHCGLIANHVLPEVICRIMLVSFLHLHAAAAPPPPLTTAAAAAAVWRQLGVCG